MESMGRVFLISAVGIVLIATFLVMYTWTNSPTAVDFRLAKGRSLLDSENYLGALETVLSLPETQRGKADVHTLLGTAYLRLHLYLAAIKEFESAEKQGSRRADPWIGLASSYIELGDGQKALDEATHATTIDPKSPDAWIMLGRAHWLQRNFPEAEKAALKTQEMDPSLSITQELLLHIYYDQDQPDKFQATFDRIKEPSRSVQNLAVQFFIQRGEWLKAYETQNRFDRNAIQRSIFETELALKREPHRLDLYPALIRNLVKDGRYEDAIDAGQRYKGPIPIEAELGKAYWMLGQRDAAIAQFQRASAGLVHKLSAEVALALLTGDIRHWREAYKAEHVEKDNFILSKLETIVPAAPPVVRAFVYRYAGIYDLDFYTKAAEQALKVLDEDAKNLDALLTLGTAYQRLGKMKDAVRYVEQTTEDYPNNAEAWARLASLTVGGKDPNATLNLMIKAVELDPRNAGNLYNLGWMLDQVGDVPKAITLYERAIQASPLSFEAMNNLALIYEQNGQSERALDLLQRAINVDPELGVGYFNLGNHYVRLREWRQALRTYDRVLELNAADAMAAVEKGRIHVEVGDTEAAIEDLNRALEVDSHSLDAYLLLSMAYEKLNHVKEAIAAAEEAQRIRPDSDDVKTALDRLRSLEKK
jgi:tetratricopeptide (TPR) repeat protein